MATMSRVSSRPGPTRIWFVELGCALVVFAIASSVVAEALSSTQWPSTLTALESEGATSGPPRLDKDVPTRPLNHVFDVVISGGRVMDPESGFDEVANVGIDGDQVTAISARPMRGSRVIDARRLVVAPGFIDIESYDPNSYGIWYKIADGVTTNLGMHGTNGDAEEWFARWEAQGSPAHFGGAFDDNWARQLPDGPNLGVGDEATDSDLAQLVIAADESLEGGYIGVEFSPEYAPGITFEEMVAVSEVAAEHNVPVFVHGRYADPDEPGTNFDTLNEIIDVGKETGAAMHVLHINSTGGTFTMPESLQMLEDARADGVEITADTYPYTFWATYLASERFAPGWQERFRIDYSDLVIPGIGERLDEASFEAHQAENDLAAALAIPPEDVEAALRSPFVMIGSDAILEPGDNNHPRGAGTFARVLGRYVREKKVLSLMDALHKMTIQPAQLLEEQAPALRAKGRLQIGADADITIFDPETVTDRATLKDPSRYSKGIEWVLVMGQVVKDPKRLHKGNLPGEPIKSDFSNLDLE